MGVGLEDRQTSCLPQPGFLEKSKSKKNEIYQILKTEIINKFFCTELSRATNKYKRLKRKFCSKLSRCFLERSWQRPCLQGIAIRRLVNLTPGKKSVQKQGNMNLGTSLCFGERGESFWSDSVLEALPWAGPKPRYISVRPKI
jgi:hypothetical protein